MLPLKEESVSYGITRIKSHLLIMRKFLIYISVASALMASLLSIKPIRKAFLFDTRIAYAANEPRYGWTMIGDIEVQIIFETTLASRTLSLKEFCENYHYDLESGTSVVEQWCKQQDNSLCEICIINYLGLRPQIISK